jgi:hypothetical protein
VETLERAFVYAEEQAHRQITTEHLLLALTEDSEAMAVLERRQIDLDQLRNQVAALVSRNNDRLPPGQRQQPTYSGDVLRILQTAEGAANARRAVDGALVLAALVADGQTPAAELMKMHGINFRDLVRPLGADQPIALGDPLPAVERPTSLRARLTVSGGASGSDPMAGPSPAPAVPPTASKGFVRDPLPPEAPPPPPTAQHSHLEAPLPGVAATTDHDVLASIRDVLTESEREAAQPHGAPPPHWTPPPAQTYEPPPGHPGALPPHSVYTGQADYPQEPDYHRHHDIGEAAPYEQDPDPVLTTAVPGGEDENWQQPAQTPPTPASASDVQPGIGSAADIRWERFGEPPPAAMTSDAPSWNEPSVQAPPMPPSRSGSLRRQTSPASRNPTQVDPVPPTVSRRAGGTARRDADRGKLIENIPRHMRSGVPELVEARIARHDIEAAVTGLQGRGQAVVHDVRVTRAMAVRLRSPDGGFAIESGSPETQWIENTFGLLDDDFASWRWMVTPKRAGRSRLQLVVSARAVGQDGLAAEVGLPDQIIEVRVATNYARLAQSAAGWLFVTAAAGLVGAIGEHGLSVVGRLFGH